MYLHGLVGYRADGKQNEAFNAYIYISLTSSFVMVYISKLLYNHKCKFKIMEEPVLQPTSLTCDVAHEQ